MGWLDFLSSNDQKKSGSTEAGAATSNQQIIAALQDHLATIARSQGRTPEPKGYDVNVPIHDAGYVDSLSMSEFLVLVEKQFEVKVPDWVLGESGSTLKGLAAYVAAELAKKS